jgi:hypothetical protein
VGEGGGFAPSLKSLPLSWRGDKKVMNVTLDTNCIIDLEEERDTAPDIQALIHMHDQQRINLRVVAISASERKPDGKYASNFTEFKEKIAAVGLGYVDILKPIGYYDITFWDWCLYAGAEMEELERKIHEILFPNIEFNYKEFCRKRSLASNGKEIDHHWQNAKCDVLALWSHIHYGSGNFVTTDKNFHKKTKRTALITLGAGDILKPKQAVKKLTTGS